VRPDGQPRGRQQRLHVALVHRRSRGEDPGADVGDAGELQQALQGAVLTIGTVQQRQHDVDLTELLWHLAGLLHGEASLGGIAAEHHRGSRLLDLRQRATGDGELLRFVGGEHPAPVTGDADRDDVVGAAIDRGKHTARGHARDGVLGASAAEDNGHPWSAARCGLA
jgi:hypothetical protein